MVRCVPIIATRRSSYKQSVALDLCLAALLQFAYRFPAPSPRQKWERRLTLLLSLLYVAWEISDTLVRFADLAGGQTTVRPPIMDYPLAVGFAWLVVLFMRQTVRFSPGGRGAWLRAFWRPSGPEARAARGYVFVAFGAMLLSVVEVFYATTPMSVPTRELIYSLGMLVILFAFALVYINYLPQATTFMVKLVGMALVTILAALGTLGWLSSPVKMMLAYHDCGIVERQSLRFAPNRFGGYDVAQAPFRFEADLGEKRSLLDNGEYELALPFAFPFYGQAWHAVYVSSNGYLSFGDLPHRIDSRHYYTPVPAIFALFVDLNPEWAESGIGLNDGGVFIHPARDRVTISWYRLPLYDEPEHLFTFQLRLYPDGVYEITHDRIPEYTHRLPVLDDGPGRGRRHQGQDEDDRAPGVTQKAEAHQEPEAVTRQQQAQRSGEGMAPIRQPAEQAGCPLATILPHMWGLASNRCASPWQEAVWRKKATVLYSLLVFTDACPSPASKTPGEQGHAGSLGFRMVP